MVTPGKARDPDPSPPLPAPDTEADEVLEQAFPASATSVAALAPRQLFAVIPEEVVQASPEEFAAFLDSVLTDLGEVERAVELGLAPVRSDSDSGRRAVRALIPSELLEARGADPGRFMDQVFAAFDEIELVLGALDDRRRSGGRSSIGPTMVVFPDEVIGDPEALIRAVDRVQSEAEKLELLLRQARHTLRRLQVYRLSRKHPGELISEMRRADHVRTLQYVVEFLRSIQLAAESFEQLELPRPHIRDYLEHLYSLEDWDQMAELVGTLRRAVVRYLRSERHVRA